MVAKKSRKTMKKVGPKSKQSVSIDMVKDAVAALGDRNGSTIKSIFNYMVSTKKVSQSNRTLVILAIGRGVRSGVLARKLSNTFVVRVGGEKRKAAAPARKRKRKTKRTRKTSAKSTTRRRRRQRKRRSLKKKTRKSTKRSRKTVRKLQKKRKARRSRKTNAKKPSSTFKPIAKPMESRRPVRRAARRINYRE